MLTIHYRSHSGARRAAHVLLPAWYGRRRNPALPLIISPHGRGLTGRENAALWGDLPARGRFVVVNPDGQGRRLGLHSWGYAGQIADLAQMPMILRRALPWLRLDRRRVYAFGGSMGGQESLLLLAHYPRLLAGVAVFDAVTDFALQYERFPRSPCQGHCRRAWRGSFGRRLQQLARREVGGSPRTAPGRYAARSPLAYLHQIAFSCVPLQMWWSVADRIVPDQQQQSGRLFWDVRRRNPAAPVQAFVGFWIHSSEMRASAALPLALATFELHRPSVFDGIPSFRFVPPPSKSDGCDPASRPLLYAR